MDFSISVIIPVYNAAAFIEKAVGSALQQSQVEEVIVVNDGSTDNSLQILMRLQQNDSRIKIYHHQNGLNKGRSASRNLALKKASMPYIAFLDADDFFLEKRFEAENKIFNNDPSVEGVYNAIGVHFYRPYTDEEFNSLSLVTLTEPIPPDLLFQTLLHTKNGYFSIDGLTIKKEVLNKIGFFEEHLVVAEDTEWLLKMTLKCKLVPGNIYSPVAKRGVHDFNVFNKNELYKYHRQKKFESLIQWSLKNKIENYKINLLVYWLFHFRYKQKYSLKDNMIYWLYVLRANPQLILSKIAIKNCPLIRKRRQIFNNRLIE